MHADFTPKQHDAFQMQYIQIFKVLLILKTGLVWTLAQLISFKQITTFSIKIPTFLRLNENELVLVAVASALQSKWNHELEEGYNESVWLNIILSVGEEI